MMIGGDEHHILETYTIDDALHPVYFVGVLR